MIGSGSELFSWVRIIRQINSDKDHTTHYIFDLFCRILKFCSCRRGISVPVVGNLLELLLPHFMVDEEDPGHNPQHLVQQVHLRDRVLLVSCTIYPKFLTVLLIQIH